MKALICGAGVAGLTLAWQLERSGWEVELVERASGFREGGYMLDFSGAGLRVVERMGLLPELHRVRYPVTSISYVDDTGRQTSGLTLSEKVSAEVVSVMRGDLARLVYDQVTSPILYGTSVAEVEQSGERVTVRLTDDSAREVDLLVGADGAHSRVRDLVFGPEQCFVRFLDHRVAAFVIENARLSEQVGMRYQMLTKPGLMAGAYALRGGKLATLFLWHETGSDLPDDAAVDLRHHFGGMGWIVPELLSACPSTDQVYCDQITQVEMTQWSKGRVVLLGDACQAVSLFAGYGASLGMAAAWVLADELARATLDRALARYQARMAPAVAGTQRFGRGFIKWMAPPSRARIAVRDLIVRAGNLPGMDRVLFMNVTPSGHRLIGA